MARTVDDYMKMPLKHWPFVLKQYVQHIVTIEGFSGGVLSDCVQAYIDAQEPDNAQVLIDKYKQRKN